MLLPQDPTAHLKLAYHTVNLYLSNRPWCRHLKEDLEGAALFGLLKACKSYDSDKGEWSHYAGTIIKNQIITEVRLLSRATKISNGTHQTPPKSVELMTDAELENSLSGRHETPDPEFLMCPQQTRTLMKGLSKREREIINLWFGIKRKNALSDGEIGERIGLSRYSVWVERTRAMSKMAEQATKAA